MLGYSGRSGRRHYLLHVPAGQPAQDAPLLLMLHGGMQTAEDFAAATKMNDAADRHGFVVAYPQQSRSANPNRFWNWFEPKNQHAGSGEPDLLAGLTNAVLDENGCDRNRVFVAGFSSGGAMAAIVAACYPDLFAGVGVHSGLAYGAADDMLSGLQAMQEGGQRPRPLTEPLPIIVFHGDRDSTVSPINARRLIESSAAAMPGATMTTRNTAASPQQWSHTVDTYFDEDGSVVAERWIAHGGGHDWFGGTRGRFADQRGPSASVEFLRFFSDVAAG